MAKKSFSENVTFSGVLIDGLKGRKDNLPLGITAETITELENLKKKLEKLNSEQEKLKADLKTKTEEVNKTSTDLEDKLSLLKKRLKIEIPQTQWREFGIEDKR